MHTLQICQMSEYIHATCQLLIKVAALEFLAKLKCLKGQGRGEKRSGAPYESRLCCTRQQAGLRQFPLNLSLRSPFLLLYVSFIRAEMESVRVESRILFQRRGMGSPAGRDDNATGLDEE